MENSKDKSWAKSYLLDPLSEPQPSEETGPGTHFRPESATPTSTLVSPPKSANRLSKSLSHRSAANNPYASPTSVSGKSQLDSYPTPPHSASPHQDRFPTSRRGEAFSNDAPSQARARVHDRSLGERYPGDMSHRPLQQIKKDAKSAHRAPHLRKSHLVRPDTVDSLSTVGGGPYHHEGPFDAALFARNTTSKTSPLDALDHSTRETLKATPQEKILDSVRGHRPLDGVAMYAPGEADRNGHVYEYEQGDNMMTSGNPEGGAYKRWPDVNYHPNDVKGKGEPSYSIERGLKGQDGDVKGLMKALSGGEYEMTPKQKYAGDGLSNAAGNDAMWGDGEEHRGSLKNRLVKAKNHLHRET